MAVPTIAALPAAPSRLGDPTNFYAESLTFLEAQQDFADECNAVRTYLNDAQFNVNDWGLVSDPITGGSATTISNFPAAAPTNPPLTGYELISAIDDMLVDLAAFVSDGNTVASYIDGFTDPAAPVVVDPARPTVAPVADSQARTDTPAHFNSAAITFYNSARSFALTLDSLSEYVTDYLSGTEDWALITTSHTSSEDWGSITS
jgi:hypothetical protein